MPYLQAQMVYLIRPPLIARNVDELLHLWIFIYLKYSDLHFTPQDAYTSCLALPLGHHGNNAVTSRSHGFFATLTNAGGRFLTKYWQLSVSYKLWQCYCFLKLLLPSVWQNNLPSLEVSYPNSWATSLFPRGSAVSVVEISSTCRG